VRVCIKARKVWVKGPRGILTKDLSHAPVTIAIKGDKIIVSKFFGVRKTNAQVRAVLRHIENMIIGVTKGYKYTMRLVYAHFPINVTIEGKDKNVVEIRNFLGEKVVRTVNCRGSQVKWNKAVKDCIVVEGNDKDLVSQDAANIQQICAVKNKDLRKFLDGIYVSEKYVLAFAFCFPIIIIIIASRALALSLSCVPCIGSGQHRAPGTSHTSCHHCVRFAHIRFVNTRAHDQSAGATSSRRRNKEAV
jgi:large subunit ribosomal protein L9e